MSVTLVNLFEVAPERDEAFRSLWHEVNDFMRTQPGYVNHQLHRALTPSARFRYVNIAVWESAQAVQAAHATDGFRKRVGQPEWREFPSSPALFEQVHSGSAAKPIGLSAAEPAG